jgi:hypothetical protein
MLWRGSLNFGICLYCDGTGSYSWGWLLSAVQLGLRLGLLLVICCIAYRLPQLFLQLPVRILESSATLLEAIVVLKQLGVCTYEDAKGSGTTAVIPQLIFELLEDRRLTLVLNHPFLIEKVLRSALVILIISIVVIESLI